MDLYEQRRVIWERMQELAHRDGEAGMSAEDKAAYLEAEKDLDALTADIDLQERHVAREKELAAKAAERSKLIVPPISNPLEVVTRDSEQYNEAFWDFMKGGMRTVKPAQRELLEANFRALSVGTGSEGGFTAPDGFIAKIVDAIDDFSGVRQVGRVTKIRTNDGQDLPIPTGDDTGNTGALLAENTVVPEQDLAFGQKVLKGYTWTSKMIKVSIQLLNDSAVDIETYLARKLGERIGRAQAPYFITGTGTGQPEGIVTNATTGHTTANGQQTTLLYTDFVALEHSVATPYRKVGQYLLSDDAVKEARLILDTTNRPIWVPSMSGTFPSTINGYAYTVDDNMADVAASAKPVLFGDLSYYWIRDIKDITLRRLDERFADYLQVAFIAFSRMDARPIDAGNSPWKVMTMDAV